MANRYAVGPGFLAILAVIMVTLCNSGSAPAQAPGIFYNWKLSAAPGPASWKSIASSSDGTRLVAALGEMDGDGYIYTSTDSGTTWAPLANAGQRNWTAVACSSDGARIVAVVFGGYIYTSTDFGATWTERASAGTQSWNVAASSSDGMKLVAAESGNGTTGGSIYTSADGGATWTPWTIGLLVTAVTMSSDGTKIAAAVYGGYILTSADSGITWAPQTGSGFHRWLSIASSSDGTKLVAAAIAPPPYSVTSHGNIYTSTDSGATWAQGIAGNWSAVASSSDGMKFVASESEGYIYTSTDSGATWTQQQVNS